MPNKKTKKKPVHLSVSLKTHKEKVLWGVAGLLSGIVLSIIVVSLFSSKGMYKYGCEGKKGSCSYKEGSCQMMKKNYR